jgi:hypothetical protein
MLVKIFIVFVGSAVLLGSAAVGWGTVFRVVNKSAQTISFKSPELRLDAHARSLPAHLGTPNRT